VGGRRHAVAGAALGARAIAGVRASHLLEALLARSLAAGLRRLPWPAALQVGAGLGAMVGALGLRRRVAEANLALAFPERPPAERAAILAEHYRELGRVASEYPRMPELVHRAGSEVFAAIRGAEHLEAARTAGRGAILLTGHFGNFELLGARLGRMHPVDFVVRPLANPAVERTVSELRRRSGVGIIPLGAGVRRVFDALRANRWVAMVADQDARRHGVFVPFFGRLTSTPIGPAAMALRTGAPIVMGFVARQPDGRHTLDLLPPLPADGAKGTEAARALTARHTAELEAWIRRHPAMWFWLHRRWKTAAPCGGS
jgi:Kdo2-lipid IVA lauroyltransferase/acyltransferase